MHRVFRNKTAIFLFVAPGMLLFALTFLVPIIVSGYYSFTDTLAPGTKVTMVGFDNYTNLLFHDERFWLALRNALLLGIGFIVIQHPICIFFAILLDRLGGKAEKIFRTIFFIPCVISVVVISKMWLSLLDPTFGMLNKLLDLVGLDSLKHAWLGESSTALGSMLFILIWAGFGWGLLFYYAGVKGISEDLYEAAQLDGASGFRMHLKITVPLLKPVIAVQFTLAIITALKQMETVFLTTNGGPGDSTQFLAVYLYNKAFSASQYGYANAISVLFVIVCLLATYLSNRLTRSDATDF
ncbi:carbohydrate ABC transporter membrane protein 1 (CUT1 family) [Paenibacillus cellulosilyticus]|uniref:Carbohydrate ABC transporter membrane protein 1 (CUT1 family) n=1 Tax=Paenibacillus cellulosilyticus TaxID=375489 RepID=A0A2V2YZT6_9BACL|nr:sugar ABC transporter permease [Paenibacillus cellulosilyticus]PWW07307.1 carbohydrate ABC transporter membrane protein 1 (CUT1 family) [Paenibacillus cellulosilyticus]QKS44506.1 sugar ABC transporter permease [Paenibacillus cellulosilyticus]